MRQILSATVVIHLFTLAAFPEEPAARGGCETPDVGTIRVVDGEETVSITLGDAFAYHGHPCPGSTVAFRGVQLATRLLWSETVPRRRDIVVLSRGSMYGVLDVFALVTRGPIEPKADAISQPSRVLKAMPVSRESFAFTIIRRSTGQAVHLRVNPGLYPDDFFVLRERAANGSATSAERHRLKGYREELIRTIPRLTEAELFESPVQYRLLMFGA